MSYNQLNNNLDEIKKGNYSWNKKPDELPLFNQSVEICPLLDKPKGHESFKNLDSGVDHEGITPESSIQKKNKCVLDMKWYRKDVKIKMSKIKIGSQTEYRNKPLRGHIKLFSKRSKKKLKFTLNNARMMFDRLITLTYPKDFIEDGKEAKKHINAFLQYLRRKDIHFIWTLEFQKNGSPHFHLIVDRYIDKDDLSKTWYNIVGSGNIKHLRAGTNIEKVRKQKNVKNYFLKEYVQKQESKNVPLKYKNVGRFWGNSRAIMFKEKVVQVKGTEENMHKFLRILKNWHINHLKNLSKKIKSQNNGKGKIIKWKKPCYGFTAYDMGKWVGEYADVQFLRLLKQYFDDYTVKYA